VAYGSRLTSLADPPRPPARDSHAVPILVMLGEIAIMAVKLAEHPTAFERRVEILAIGFGAGVILCLLLDRALADSVEAIATPRARTVARLAWLAVILGGATVAAALVAF
jgi:hypothetical protein